MSVKHKVDVTSARLPNGGWNEVDGKRVRQVVGQVDFLQYDSFAEAVKEVGEAECLKHINAQIATNAKNKARALAVGGPSEKELQAEATNRILTTPEKMAGLQGCAGDAAAIANFIAREVAALKKERGLDKPDEETEVATDAAVTA